MKEGSRCSGKEIRINGWSTTTTQMAEYYVFVSNYLPVSPAGTNKYLYDLRSQGGFFSP